MENTITINWRGCSVFLTPYPHIICDDFVQEFTDEMFPDWQWTTLNLTQRENRFTRGISAIYSLDRISEKPKSLLQKFLSQEFHDNICRLLNIDLVGESTGLRKSVGEYRIAREAQIVENSYTQNNVVELHHDNPVTIWTGILYFVDSAHGSFNIHDEAHNIVKKIPVRKNRMIITLNSNKTWHSVSPWLETTPRKSIYTTAEFKNDGRDQNRMPINATELWIKNN